MTTKAMAGLSTIRKDGLGFGPRGAVSRRRVARTLCIFAALIAASGLASLAFSTPALVAFTLGMAFPGAGFTICGAAGAGFDLTALALAGGSAALFAFAAFLWFATGNLLGPPIVWLASAAAASVYAVLHGCLSVDQGFVSASLLALAAGSIMAGVWLYRPIPAARPDMQPATDRLAATFSFHDAPQDSAELSDDDLSRIRFLLDRALQPLDRFDGFEKLDQFQSAALRYQLQFAGFALATVQRNQLPALQAYLTEAQANLIEKARDHRVWRYWSAESIWGRGCFDPNPFAADNIMYTGFCATQIALFQAASGDRRFSQPGAFSLTHQSGRRFNADFPSLVDNIVKQHACSAFGLIACEPNWLFPVCNSIGYGAIAAHDAQFGTTHWVGMTNRQQTMIKEEFTDSTGRFITCRSSLTGLAMPAIGGILTQLLPSFFLNASMPDLAVENWDRLRGGLLEQSEAGMRARLRSFWPIDVGNYRFTRIAGLCGTAATAVELGDEEVSTAMLEALDLRCPITASNGQGHRNDASIWAHAFEVMARCGRRNSLRDLVRNPSSPEATRSSPHIATCPYPDALVAKAVSNDGQLDIVLVPGSGARRVSIGVAGLKPLFSYRRSDDGSGFSSGPNGTASLDVSLRARTRLVVSEAA